MEKVSKQELSMQIDSAWQNGMNSDEMADWLISTVFANNWQPIETAPRTGSVLAWFECDQDSILNYMAITSWDDNKNEWIVEEDHYSMKFFKPTKWMPLPGIPA